MSINLSIYAAKLEALTSKPFIKNIWYCKNDIVKAMRKMQRDKKKKNIVQNLATRSHFINNIITDLATFIATVAFITVKHLPLWPLLLAVSEMEGFVCP